MSERIFTSEDGTIRVTSYCGPVRDDGDNRRRIQIDADPPADLSTLSIGEARELVVALNRWMAGLPASEQHPPPTITLTRDMIVDPNGFKVTILPAKPPSYVGVRKFLGNGD